MASSLLGHYFLSIKTHPLLSINPPRLLLPCHLSKLVFPSPTPTSTLTLNPPLYASSSPPQGISDNEDSKFVPLNEDDPVFGPPALLLLGFQVDEAAKIQQFLRDLGGEFMQIIFCTEEMIPQSLWKAMHTSQPNLDAVKIAKSLPRICFLSGLSGEEMIMFIDAFPEAGLEPAVFAALVPNSADKPLEELIEEIMGDHELLTSNQSESS